MIDRDAITFSFMPFSVARSLIIPWVVLEFRWEKSRVRHFTFAVSLCKWIPASLLGKPERFTLEWSERSNKLIVFGSKLRLFRDSENWPDKREFVISSLYNQCTVRCMVKLISQMTHFSQEGQSAMKRVPSICSNSDQINHLPTDFW